MGGVGEGGGEGGGWHVGLLLYLLLLHDGVVEDEHELNVAVALAFSVCDIEHGGVWDWEGWNDFSSLEWRSGCGLI